MSLKAVPQIDAVDGYMSIPAEILKLIEPALAETLGNAIVVSETGEA